MTKHIKVLIADDHPFIRQGIRYMVEEIGDSIQIIGEAADGVAAVLKARALQPDVILLDLNMPRKSGLEVIREIVQEHPDARILVLTAHATDDEISALIKAGAMGLILKNVGSEELIKSVEAVYRGEFAWPPSVVNKLVHNFQQPAPPPITTSPLTEREMQVLELITNGASNQVIAAALYLSEATVSTHVSNILSKLQLHNRVQAALYALKKGMVNLNDLQLN